MRLESDPAAASRAGVPADARPEAGAGLQAQASAVHPGPAVPAAEAPAAAAQRPPLRRAAQGYLVVGGLAAVVDIGLFHLFAPHLNGVLLPGLLLPAALSFLLAAVVNYSLSALWLYRRRWRSARRAAAFLLFATLGLCINASATWLIAAALPIAPTLAKAGGVVIAFVANFLMNTFIVFRGEDAR